MCCALVDEEEVVLDTLVVDCVTDMLLVANELVKVEESVELVPSLDVVLQTSLRTQSAHF